MQFLARGARVAIGTDSLASNPDLSVLEEIRHLYRGFPQMAPATLLHMATAAGAAALGWGNETGSLRPSKFADLVVVPIDPAAIEPCAALLRSSAPVTGVMYRGRWLVSPPGVPA
jgi:imidazolonepropionase-like amidohydrolase